MKVTISSLRCLARESRDSILQFNVTFKWLDEGREYVETHKRAIAGRDKEGRAWVRPPTPNPRFPTTDWSESLKGALVEILEKHRLLDNLETPFKQPKADERSYE